MEAGAKSSQFETSLGPRAELHTSIWVLDLAELPIFHGLSVLSRALADIVVEQARTDRVAVHAERSIRPRENPELLTELGIDLVSVSVEHETIASITRHPELFEEHLRSLFGTLQRKRYREALIQSSEGPASRALVFHFSFPGEPEAVACRFLLEFVRSQRAGDRGYLRVLIEDLNGRHLSLDSLPHVIVEDLESRTFIAGSTRIAQTWREGVRREAERGRRSFSETRKRDSHLFRQLEKAGLSQLERVDITWGDPSVARLLNSEPQELDHMLKKVLLALEDRGVRKLLANREVLRIDLADFSIYLDTSQHSRVLNLSLGQLRERVDIDHFLERMPATAEIVRASPSSPLRDVSVFLIHHMTAEVLGLIAALRRLGCVDLVTLFVAYSGEAPGAYLGPLLDLPTDEFQALALAAIPGDRQVEGHYRLSSQYSPVEEDSETERALARGRPRFLDAMKSVAKLEFLLQLARAREQGRRCLIIEDGGYLGPALNQACLEGATLREFVKEENPDCGDARPLAELMKGHLIGSTEHTRTGFNRLSELEERFGRLAFPSYTIAISRRKIEVEAREVALSLLNASENVLNACGLVLSKRSSLVLGSRGAIGRHVVRFLAERSVNGSNQVAGVDLTVGSGPPEVEIAEAARYADLDDDVRLGTDFVLGVTGVSTLEGVDLEEWLLRGRPREILFVSGSTKTEEFAGLSSWLESLLAQPAPRLSGRPTRIIPQEVRDPLTGRVFAQRYGFTIEGEGETRQRFVTFVANLMPVNFLFYGVPTEVIDGILAELLECSVSLATRSAHEDIPLRLLAVDRDITPTGDRLA